MIKADASSLEQLSKTIRDLEDKILLEMNVVFRIRSSIESSCNASQISSYEEICASIQKAARNIEKSCDAAQDEIADIITLVEKYDSIHF